MIKILIYGVSNNFGGIETFFINLIKNINTQKYQFDFITSSEEPCMFNKEILEAGGINHSIVTWGTNSFEHKRQVTSIIQAHNYDYVWINTASASKYDVYKSIANSTDAKIIIHSHGASLESKRKGIKKQLLVMMHHMNKHKLNQITDLKFASSQKAGQWLFGKQAENGNVHIIKNGIDVQKYSFDSEKRKQIREKYNFKDKFVVGHVGRLAEVKNQSYLIRIFHEVQKKKKNSILLLIGSGDLESNLKKQVNQLGLNSSVLFLGYHENASPFLSAMDVFVLPSIHEGLSIAAAEAQAADLYCFLSDTVPQEVEITSDVEFLSIKERPEVWAERILKVNNKVRKDNHKEFERKKFDINSTIKEVEKILAENLQRVNLL